MTNTTVKIVLVVINYKKSELTERLMRTLVKASGLKSVRLVVVDNDSDNSSRRVLEGLKGFGVDIDLLFEDRNWGYFGGAQRGLEYIQAHGIDPDWVIISNSDIEFHDPNFMSRLLALDVAGDVGVIAPRIESGLSARSQNPYLRKRPTARRMHFYKWCFSNRWTCFAYQLAGLVKQMARKSLGSDKAQGQPADNPMDVYAAHGSFMIFSRAYFERGSDFTHGAFLFNEEVTVAEKCRRVGLKIRYEPSLRVYHEEHATMGLIPSRRTLGFLREASAFAADTYFPLGFDSKDGER